MKTKFTIGRDQSADIPIADASVSRHHAEITLLAGGKVFLTDCRSSNGTFVVRGGAERRITQETLTTSDTAKFGDVSIRVSELLAALGQASGAGGGAPTAQAPSGKLVRCDCGAIKTEHSPCPSCSQ
ncbi:MAG: FHA domain-containing protein [Acidobacteriota bacterium]|nr:FHA domain-containing protein [Acidobacteriota bacterium]